MNAQRRSFKLRGRLEILALFRGSVLLVIGGIWLALQFHKSGPPLLQRWLPFWVANWVDRLKIMLVPLLALLLPVLKVLPPAYCWRIGQRILRWHKELKRVDLELTAEPCPMPSACKSSVRP